MALILFHRLGVTLIIINEDIMWATKKTSHIYFYQRVDLECPRERKMLVRERSRKQKCSAKDDMYMCVNLDVKLWIWYANFAKGSRQWRESCVQSPGGPPSWSIQYTYKNQISK